MNEHINDTNSKSVDALVFKVEAKAELISVLMDFIRRATSESATPREKEILPAVAAELSGLLNSDEPQKPRARGMFIREALIEAHRKGLAVTRLDDPHGMKIIPTNAGPCCILYVNKDGTRLGRHWNPKLDDLTLPVWIVKE